MKTKLACCDLTKNVAAFEARNTISSNFRFRLQDLPKIIARNRFVKPISHKISHIRKSHLLSDFFLIFLVVNQRYIKRTP